MRRAIPLMTLMLLVTLSVPAWAQSRFPPPDFSSPYQLPQTQYPVPRADWQEVLDVAALVAALCLATWLIFRVRSRRWIAALSVGSLLYFGFYRRGCICPIGAIQNVTLALSGWGYVIPIGALLFFALPLVVALFFGRVFCSAVCPLGAIQDVVLLKQVRIPAWLARGLSVIPFLYLGAAVFLAATNTLFIICRYDPFVSFFRLNGPMSMLVAGGVVLALGTIVGRPYCRFLCPYGAILGLLSRVSWRKVSVTPDDCIKCRLCGSSCPFGAIRKPTTETGENVP